MTLAISHNQSQEQVARSYRERQARFEAERARLAGRGRAISNARLVTFLVLGTAIGLLLFGAPVSRLLLLGVGAVALLLFLILIVLHDRVIGAETRAAGLAALNGEGLNRLQRDWDHLPAPARQAETGISADLDLLGRASLLHLLGPLGSPPGQRTLAAWLLEPAAAGEVQSRQAAVRELAPLLDWRQELSLRARGASLGKSSGAPGLPDPEPFLLWCEGEPWMLGHLLRTWLPRLLALSCLILLALNLLDLVRPWWVLLALGNLAVVGLLGRQAAEVFEKLSAREREYRRYAELIELSGVPVFESPALHRIQAALAGPRSRQPMAASGEPTLSAASELHRLDRYLGLAEARRNGLISIPLQALLLWDLQVLWLLERWRARAGRALRGWLDRLGELEALAALGALHHDEPEWVFPELLPPHPTLFEAEGLGHPLIPVSRRVTNDVSVGPEGSFLLVTGSNLSGKSTLLRALGLGVVLAGTGAPVCARRLRLSPLRLGTSFRVQDSLEQGVSFFLAELQRLKQVVDRARLGEAGERPLLYLLDEILLGTNIAERQTAVRRVLAHLLEAGAIGAVATHDLTLASAEGLAEACRPVHFREQFEEGPEGVQMTFDYRLRAGVAPTTNALKLLELIGLAAPPARPG